MPPLASISRPQPVKQADECNKFITEPGLACLASELWVNSERSHRHVKPQDKKTKNSYHVQTRSTLVANS